MAEDVIVEPMKPARPRRPAALVVIAILNLIFGVLGILLGLCGFAVMGTSLGDDLAAYGSSQPGQVKGANWADVQIVIMEREPTYLGVLWSGMIIDFLASIALIISGLGLLRVRRWARRLTIAYGVLQFLHTLWYSTYMLVVIAPLMAAIRDEVLANTPQGFGYHIAMLSLDLGYLGTIVACILGPVYPLVVLVFMFLPSVVSAFRRPEPAPGSATV